MKRTLIKSAQVVDGKGICNCDVLIEGQVIKAIGSLQDLNVDETIDATGFYLIPGVIDAQVHFRDPGLTWKADLFSESQAAVAGGVTTIIDMPNTIPNVISKSILDDKYAAATDRSFSNYGFLLGLNRDNWKEWSDDDLKDVLAITDDGLYFAGPGNLLCQFPEELSQIFKRFPDKVIALHCEDERIIEDNIENYIQSNGNEIDFEHHHLIRSAEACFSASQRCVELAKSTGGRLHVFHLTSGRETCLFESNPDITTKRVTTEVCVQNLLFSNDDYRTLGAKIKWNPSIKTAEDREQLWEALLDDRIDLITTDHAPHLMEEKQKPYLQSMSGAPMIQHGLLVMLDFVHQGRLSLIQLVQKMSHNPALLLGIERRGFIVEGYYADLVLVDLNARTKIGKEDLLYKCGWSPLEGMEFQGEIKRTWVNGVSFEREGSPMGQAIKRSALDL